jgi:hypothetical protein
MRWNGGVFRIIPEVPLREWFDQRCGQAVDKVSILTLISRGNIIYLLDPDLWWLTEPLYFGQAFVRV